MKSGNLNKVLRQHLRFSGESAPTIFEDFQGMDHPNVQVAMNAYIGATGRSAELIGVQAAKRRVGQDLLAALARYSAAGWHTEGARVGPPAYREVGLGENESITCVQNGIYLIRDGDERIAVTLQGPDGPFQSVTRVTVMTHDEERGKQFLAALRKQMNQHNVYRGRVLEITANECRSSMSIRSLPNIARENLVLPAELLGRIEQHTLGFSAHREILTRAGRHLKRGLLFHGAPGTGKTLTALYLAGCMKDRTVLLVAGDSLPAVGGVCDIARRLQPSLIILEDVDLIAENRITSNPGVNRVLYDLLNEMDGMSEDADVMFLLTTNRPEVLEPALAARPGRVDNAFEIPLPDADCRKRLFDLYAAGMQLGVDDWDRLIQRTDGVTASFIRELLRTAALYAVNGSEQFTVRDQHLDDALRDMTLAGGALKRSILGASQMGFAAEGEADVHRLPRLG